MIYASLLALLPLCVLFAHMPAAHASETNGMIDSTYKYARVCHDTACSTYGTVNFKPTGSTAVTVTDSGITGYAWGDEIGWINFAPTDSGVSVNVSTGALSGYAYANTGSWINFAPTSVSGGTTVGVSINSSGELTGWAWVSGASGGWLKFDCSADVTCVKTDWRPSGARSSTAGPANGSAGGGNIPSLIGATNVQVPVTQFSVVTRSRPPRPTIELVTDEAVGGTGQDPAAVAAIPTDLRSAADKIAAFYNDVQRPEPLARTSPDHVESYDAPLTIAPTQIGLMVWDFTPQDAPQGARRGVTIEIPRAAATDTVSMFVEPVHNAAIPRDKTLVSGTVYDVTARRLNGEEVHLFARPITITLAVPDVLQRRTDLGVYYQRNGDLMWTKIDDAIFSEVAVSFTVDHLTHFAILASRNDSSLPSVVAKSTTGLMHWWWLLMLCIVLLLIIIERRTRRSR